MLADRHRVRPTSRTFSSNFGIDPGTVCISRPAGIDSSNAAKPMYHGARVYFDGDGCPLDSGTPKRLWFYLGPRLSRVDDAVVGDRLDDHRLLCEAKEKFATAF